MKKLSYFLFAFIWGMGLLQAQPFTKDSIKTVVGTIGAYLEGYYPFPEIGKQYGKMLKKNTSAYLKITDRDALATRLNRDLQGVHKDVHLRISVMPENKGVTNVFEESNLKRDNYGFKDVELDRVTATAYISIPYGFNNTQEGFEMASHAMNMAAYSNYVVIDLRDNGGGAGGMGHFLASYFFEPGEEKFYLDGFTKENKNLQEYTYGYVPGKRLTKAKLYILIDKDTGSASEGFAFAMQKLKRATIVGEASAGAGIAGAFVQTGDRFEMFIPVKMVVAPGTLEGWEATGVIPDIVTGSEDAFVSVKNLILKEELEKPETTPAQKEVLQWKLDDLDFESKLYGQDKPEYNADALVGNYSESESVAYSNGRLYWVTSQKGKPTVKLELLPLQKDVFVIPNLYPQHGVYAARLYIKRDAGGIITGATQKVFRANSYITAKEMVFKGETK